MPRPIKFRAWNLLDSRPEERMQYGVYLDPEGKVCLPDGEFYDIPLMQFTGLKDKNGKEIYEGDLLKGQFVIGVPVPHVVSWDEKRYSFDLGGAYAVDMPYIEVIGNIHENPELLK